MSLYEKIQELKNQIAAGAISGYTALDLFMQHVEHRVTDEAGVDDPAPSIPEEDHPDWIKNAIPPVPEPASAEPADGQTAVADSE